MADKFVLMDLDDEKSKDIAEVLKNKTCRKILDYLGDKDEASEQDIATALKIPINTTEYNLKKLIKSGLVEKVKNFFWSVKGRKIAMYKLAKKHIIISPKMSKPNPILLRGVLPILAVIAIVAIFIALLYSPSPGSEPTVQDNNIKQFSSLAELKDFVKTSSQDSNFYEERTFGALGKGGVATTTAGVAESAQDSGGSAQDFSETNIQVEGVDEPDIVKNDGKYIYTIVGNKIVIVNAYPAENMEIVSEIELEAGIREIFVNGDKLIIFTQGFIAYNRVAGTIGGNSVLIYDISDKANPELEKEIETDGNYVDARMIGDYVYVINSKYVQLGSDEQILPVLTIDGVKETAVASDVYYWPHPDSSYVFTSILALDLENNEHNQEIFLTGASHNLYVSEDNIYLTYTKYIESQDYTEAIVEEVYLEILPSEYDEQIQEIIDSEEQPYQKLNKIQKLVTDYSDSLTGSQKSEFDKELLEALEEFEVNIQKKRENTVIHKINVDELEIEYKTNGEVPGHVLNQFSMDEYKGDFRIATTTGEVWGGSSLNHLYVLDEDLDIIGSVEDLAPGEKIYSARFMGKRAYVVTFKKVDPLFVIDLSKPSKPKVLGYLKITGYSDYLHPYDENHVIGIGKETVEAQDELKEGRGLDFAWYQGVKVSLFDVSDVENPIEKAKFEIGDRGTDSDALYEHKAILFDREKNLLVLPISLHEIDESQYEGKIEDNTYGKFVWQGAFVLNIDTNGISERGRITHNDETLPENEDSRWYNGDYNKAIKRSLFMDDYLYTISNSMIKANNLQTVHEINSIDLGFEEDEIVYGVAE